MSSEEAVTWKGPHTPIYNSTHVTAKADNKAASMMKTSPSLVPKSNGVLGVDDIAVLGDKRARLTTLEHLVLIYVIHAYSWAARCCGFNFY
jgi:hypothetical protein